MPEQIGSWRKERDIGSGGFGTVVLWANEDTAEKIAVKQCRWGEPGSGTEALLSPKVRERWQKEVEIMLKLDHRGIVRCMPLPAAFCSVSTALPRLCMEFCVGGDLRRVLLSAENCCGLPELEVRQFLSDITDAVGYLHGLRIIHRDLKPENVVLQQEDGRNLYKLIDLGYAKELDQSSVCTSFVGTLQYLAPELFLTNKYTCTADYWSLGLVAHEVVTGVRPFLPNMLPAKWMQEVSRKGPEDICAEELDNGTIIFRSEIIGCTQICSPLRRHLELWLRRLLDWEPRRRGRVREDSPEVVVFSQLQELLARKVVAVFCVPVCQLLHMEIGADTTMADVQKFIMSKTGLDPGRQDLRLPRGNRPDTAHHQSALQCWAPPQEETEWVLYVFDAASPAANPATSMELPPLVLEMLKDTEHRPGYYRQRAIYAQSVFLIREQRRLLGLLHRAQHVHMLSLAGSISRLRRLCDCMNRDLARLQAASELFEASLACDDELYCRQAETGGVTSARVHGTWRQAGHQVQKRLVQGYERFTQLEASVAEVVRRGTELQRVPAGRPSADGFAQFYEKACEVYEIHRRRPKEQRVRRTPNSEMIRIVVKFVKNREKPLADVYQMLTRQQECQREVEALSRPVADAIQQLQTSLELLMRYQRQRQTEIWKFMDLVLRASSLPAAAAPAPAPAAPSVSSVLDCAEAAASAGEAGVNAAVSDGVPDSRHPTADQDVMVLSQILDSATLETCDAMAENLNMHKQMNGVLQSPVTAPPLDEEGVDWSFLD